MITQDSNAQYTEQHEDITYFKVTLQNYRTNFAAEQTL
jgi:hypothetical protein